MAEFNTRLLEVDPIQPSKESILEAAELISAGDVVAFPTETVYGLGGDATNSVAVNKIFEVKRRPADNPLIAHFSSLRMLEEYVDDIPELAYRLADVFWPGPLTLVLHKSGRFADEVTKGLPTVAVRIPAHGVATAIIEAAGVPIAAPSANLSGRPSPTSANHVLADFKGSIPLIIDGGTTSVGVESTVVNLVGKQPVLLRPGGVTPEELSLFIPDLVLANNMEQDQPLSPGMKYSHYTPNSHVILVPNGFSLSDAELDRFAQTHKSSLILCTNSTHNHSQPSSCLGADLKEVQLNLFASLRLLDDQNFAYGIFEGVSPDHEGFAIMNRIGKAADSTHHL
ncbi:MAG: L-threonylcarbamoyladenylate synthase [Candidatus Kariarchaeaceae archaeon]|jgi:L-threonylcarbamoyladenylate synthase